MGKVGFQGEDQPKKHIYKKAVCSCWSRIPQLVEGWLLSVWLQSRTSMALSPRSRKYHRRWGRDCENWRREELKDGTLFFWIWHEYTSCMGPRNKKEKDEARGLRMGDAGGDWGNGGRSMRVDRRGQLSRRGLVEEQRWEAVLWSEDSHSELNTSVILSVF